MNSSKIKKEIKLQREHFERIMRNTKRLERLASEILDVTKIDDQSLRLTKEYFNLKETVLDLIQDHKRQLEKSNVSTKLIYEFEIEEQEEIPIRQDDFSADIFINADKNRIIQVLDNLLTYTHTIIVRVKDTGTGIHPEVLQRLFLKLPGLRLGLVLDCSFQKILWKHMVGRSGERITPTEKELHLSFVYLQCRT